MRVSDSVLSAEGDESGSGDKVLEGGLVVADGDEAVVFGLEVVPGLSCRLPASVECLCAYKCQYRCERRHSPSSLKGCRHHLEMTGAHHHHEEETMYLYGPCSLCPCAVLFALETFEFRLLDEVAVLLRLAGSAEVDLPARASLSEKEAVHRRGDEREERDPLGLQTGESARDGG